MTIGKEKLCSYSLIEKDGKTYVSTAKHCLLPKSKITGTDAVLFPEDWFKKKKLFQHTWNPRIHTISEITKEQLIKRPILIAGCYIPTGEKKPFCFKLQTHAYGVVGKYYMAAIIPEKLFNMIAAHKKSNGEPSISGFSGSPILDENGKQVGILQGDIREDIFSGQRGITFTHIRDANFVEKMD